VGGDPREFPVQLSPVFRLIFQRMTYIEKGFADIMMIGGSVTFQHFFEDFVLLFP
jgi:hypothetical protein